MSNNNSQKNNTNKKNTKTVTVDIRKLPKRRRFNIPSILIALIVAIVVSFGFNYISDLLDTKGEEVAVSNIVSHIYDEDYDKITLRDDLVLLDYTKEEESKRKYALIPSNTDFYQILADSDIDVKDLENDFFVPAIGITFGDVVTLLFLIGGGIMVFVLLKNMQSSGGKIMDFGQSKARLMIGKKTGISFDNVAGIEEVKEELIEVVDFLKNPKKYRAAGARIPKGVLLAGAPGTGKTLLAKAVAGEAGVPFFHTSGSEFEEMLVGAGASRVRDLFQKARKAAPCIIFIDEIDAVAKKRGTVLHSGAGEQTLNQILVEMDGLEERENVIVLAATNRPDVLDPAILRPGRFDRTVVVQMPDKQGRRKILDVHAKNKKFENIEDLELIAHKTIGYSGADLENLLNEAAIMAAKEDRKVITQDDLLESWLKVKLGRKKKGKEDKNEEDLKVTAYHEAGHAIVAKFTEFSDPVEQISIISRGMAGGVTVYQPDADKEHYYKDQMLARLRNGVGGRAAEEIFIGRITTGASADIKDVTSLAKEMILNWGMSDKLGMVKYGEMEDTKHLGYTYGGGRDFSEKTAELIDAEVKKLIDEAYADAKKVLEENKDSVEKLVGLLLEKEVVTRDEFEGLFA